jgi:hypothetical protein
MFTHIAALYDVLGQSPVLVTFTLLSCHMLCVTHIREVIWEMKTSGAIDEEGFKVDCFEHGVQPLVHDIVDLFNHVVHIGFPLAYHPLDS